MLYVGWVGLRGAVPIILATVPVLAGVGGADRLFHVVFLVVVVSALVPGGTVSWASRRLGLISSRPAPPEAVLEVSALRPLSGEILSFTIHPAAGLRRHARRSPASGAGRGDADPARRGS